VVVRALTREVHHYQRRIPNDLERLTRHVRPGDVVLVEGKTRVAQIIKYLTQSSWSHSALYVGDGLISGSHPKASHYWDLYGEDSRSMIVEADLASGVEAVPLVKYADHNLRICRPFSISPEDLCAVVDEVISRIGDGYDSSHLLALGRFLAPFPLIPKRWRRKAMFSGRSSSRAVICSTLIARAFIHVRYPILPLLSRTEAIEKEDRIFPYGQRFRSIHPRFILPRDFDLSPYFRIVKFNQIEEGSFDYRSLDWERMPEDPPREDARREGPNGQKGMKGASSAAPASPSPSEEKVGALR
jgi:hypothetical protein